MVRLQNMSLLINISPFYSHIKIKSPWGVLRFLRSSVMSQKPKRKVSLCTKIGEATDSNKRSKRFSTMSQNPEDRYPSRKWLPTGLGSQIESGEYKISSKDLPFTLMSYNILADYLAQRHPELYTTTAHSEIMYWPNRFEKIIEEILEFSCDILCLQEVQNDHWSSFEDRLRSFGYEGLYKKRTGDKQDGCAIFYKPEKFVLIDQTDVEYRQPSAPSCLDRDNIGLLAKFGSKKDLNSQFCVATTHLLFNPKRHDVKTAQMALLLAEIDRFAWTNQSQNPYLPIIITGDLNCQSHHSVYELLCQGMTNYRGLSRAYVPPDQGLIPAELGITDSCQHFDVLKSRADKKPQVQGRLFHSNKTAENPGPMESMGAYYGNGSFYHNFGFKSVYNPLSRGVSQVHFDFCTLEKRDYISIK